MYINIHTDEFKGIKLYDVYRKTGEWLKSKLVWFQNGIKQVVKRDNR